MVLNGITKETFATEVDKLNPNDPQGGDGRIEGYELLYWLEDNSINVDQSKLSQFFADSDMMQGGYRAPDAIFNYIQFQAAINLSLTAVDEMLTQEELESVFGTDSTDGGDITTLGGDSTDGGNITTLGGDRKPIDFSVPGTGAINLGGLDITILGSDTKGNPGDYVGTTDHPNAVAMAKVIEAMYARDPDFQRFIEALRLTNPDGFTVHVLPIDDYGNAHTLPSKAIWLRSDMVDDVIADQFGGNHKFYNDVLQLNNIELLEEVFVHESLHAMGWEHDEAEGKPGIDPLEDVDKNTDNIFWNTMNGEDDGVTVEEYVIDKYKGSGS